MTTDREWWVIETSGPTARRIVAELRVYRGQLVFLDDFGVYAPDKVRRVKRVDLTEED